jgi:hypothetical protein
VDTITIFAWILRHTRFSLTVGFAFTLLTPFLGHSAPQALASSTPSYRYSKITASGASSTSYIVAVATDQSGDVYVAGTWNGTVTFDGQSGHDTRTTANQSVFLTEYSPAGAYGWTKVFSTTSGSSSATGVAVHGSDVYVTGNFNGAVTFDGVGGSHTQTTLGQDGFLTKFTATASGATYDQTSILDAPTGADYVSSSWVAADSSGNVYLTGYFQGSITFDGPGGTDSHSSANLTSFLTKFNSGGTYGFTKYFDTTAASSFAQGFGVATDTFGNVYMTGYFQGTVVFDGLGGTDSQSTSGSGDAYMTKFNANGTYGYTKTFDTSDGYAQGNAITTDPAGNIFITGNWSSTVIFDGIGGSDSRVDPGGSTFLTKYNANGTYGYTKVFGGTGTAIGYGLATDSSGSVYLGGSFSGTVVFDGAGGSDSVTSASNNSFLTKFNQDGSYAWTRAPLVAGGSVVGSNAGSSLATDSYGNIYLAADFRGTVTFDGSGDTDTQTSADDSGFVLSYQMSASPRPTSPVSPGPILPGAPDTGLVSQSSADPAATLALLVAAALSFRVAFYKLRHSQDRPTRLSKR